MKGNTPKQNGSPEPPDSSEVPKHWIAGFGDTEHEGLRSGDLLCNRYEIREEIGRGGMGTVYEAYDRDREQRVAVKVISPAMLGNEEVRNQFRQEAKITSDLNHPNIVNVYDLQKDGDLMFLTMELLQGKTLRQEMRERKKDGRSFSPEEAKGIIIPLCEALTYAHHFTIHRDVKPENVWMNADGRVILMDFGLAALLVAKETPNAGLSRSGLSLGTPYYMAPEQLRARSSTDSRVDQYSLSVLYYELLTGEIVAGMARPVTEFRNDLRKSLSRVINRGLSVSPDHRYPSIQDFADAIRRGGDTRFWTPKTPEAFFWSIAGIAVLSTLLATLAHSLLSRHRASVSNREAIREKARSASIEAAEQYNAAHATHQVFLKEMETSHSRLPNQLQAGALGSMPDKLQRGRELLSTDNNGTALRVFNLIIAQSKLVQTNIHLARRAIDADLQANKWLNALGDTASLSQSNIWQNQLNEAQTYLAEGSISNAIIVFDRLISDISANSEERHSQLRIDAEKARTAFLSRFHPKLLPNLNFIADPDSLMESAAEAITHNDFATANHALREAKTIYTGWRNNLENLDERTDKFFDPAFLQTHPIWTNSLGMRFVRVVENLWVSIWETRVVDYATFIEHKGEFSLPADDEWWRPLDLNLRPDFPAIGMRFEDAHFFADWLLETEHRMGTLKRRAFYSLMTLEELPKILAEAHRLDTTPFNLASDASVGYYAWGIQWPPPKANRYYFNDPSIVPKDHIHAVAMGSPN